MSKSRTHNRRVALWRDHGEVTRALLSMGLVLLAALVSAFLLRVPETSILGTNWYWWLLPVTAWIGLTAWAGISWLGAPAFVVGGLGCAVAAFLLVDIKWLYPRDHLRIAVLMLIGLLIVTLVVVAHEFSVTALRICAVLSAVVVVMFAVKIGRLDVRQDRAIDARTTATALDVQLADLTAEHERLPVAQTEQRARAERGLPRLPWRCLPRAWFGPSSSVPCRPRPFVPAGLTRSSTSTQCGPMPPMPRTSRSWRWQRSTRRS